MSFVRLGTDVLRVERDGEASEITFSLMPALAPDFQMPFDLTKWFHVKLKMHCFSKKKLIIIKMGL